MEFIILMVENCKVSKINKNNCVLNLWTNFIATISFYYLYDDPHHLLLLVCLDLTVNQDYHHFLHVNFQILEVYF